MDAAEEVMVEGSVVDVGAPDDVVGPSVGISMLEVTLLPELSVVNIAICPLKSPGREAVGLRLDCSDTASPFALSQGQVSLLVVCGLSACCPVPEQQYQSLPPQACAIPWIGLSFERSARSHQSATTELTFIAARLRSARRIRVVFIRATGDICHLRGWIPTSTISQAVTSYITARALVIVVARHKLRIVELVSGSIVARFYVC